MIDKILKDFDEEWDNRFHNDKYMAEEGLKGRVKAFFRKVLENQEEETIKELNKTVHEAHRQLQEQEKRLKLSKEEIFDVLRRTDWFCKNRKTTHQDMVDTATDIMVLQTRREK